MEEEILLKKLQKRIKAKEDDLLKIVSLVNKYDLNLNIRNFDSIGLVLFDENNRTVRVCYDGIKDQSLIKIKNPKTDIAIVYCNGLLAGWIESSRLEDAGNTMIVDAESLHTMPEKFRFVRECPHMDVHGGFTVNGDSWYCANCKEKLVFNDS